MKGISQDVMKLLRLQIILVPVTFGDIEIRSRSHMRRKNEGPSEGVIKLSRLQAILVSVTW